MRRGPSLRWGSSAVSFAPGREAIVMRSCSCTARSGLAVPKSDESLLPNDVNVIAAAENLNSNVDRCQVSCRLGGINGLEMPPPSCLLGRLGVEVTRLLCCVPRHGYRQDSSPDNRPQQTRHSGRLGHRQPDGVVKLGFPCHTGEDLQRETRLELGGGYNTLLLAPPSKCPSRMDGVQSAAP